MTVPCGHVLCKACKQKFLEPNKDEEFHLRCYVCDMDLTGEKKDGGEKEKKKGREEVMRFGLVELKSEGTGFASGGKNVVKKAGIAFHA